MSLLAIDPGTTESGFCCMIDGRISHSGVAENKTMLSIIEKHEGDLAIEMIASYGMAVGKEVFETCVWIGRFTQASKSPDSVKYIYRKDVKLKLCGTTKAKDTNVRQALIDLIGLPGTKKNPGPTYGVKSHAWPALAVAVVASDMP